MDLKLPSFDSGKLGDFKDRLGFKNNDARGDAYDAGYDDFGEYAYDDRDEAEYSDYAEMNRHSDRNESPRSSFTASTPRLVTAEEVRANTHYTPPSDDEESHVSTQRTTYTVPRNNAGYGDERRTYSQHGLSGLEVDEQYSAGLQSLFTPTTSSQDSNVSARSPRSGAASASTNERLAMKEPTVVSRHSRIMTVVMPETYEDAERVSKIVRTGDVAVLCLRSTPENLSKRVLDFSFGVACALDAHVDYVSDSVFVITRGAGLSEDEEARLRGQGLM